MKPALKKPAHLPLRRLAIHSTASSRLIVLLVGALWAQVAVSQEFECPKVRASKSRLPAYPTHSVAGICEGFYDKDISQALLEVVSVVAAKPASSLANPTAESLIFNSPGAASVPATLHIEPFRDVTLYRVDAKFQQKLEWKTATMLKETGLTLQDLGYLAIVQTGGKQDMVVLPLQLDPSSNANPQYAYITVRVFTTALTIRWRASPLKKSAGSAGKWMDANIRPIYEGSWLTFPVPLTADGLSTSVDLGGTAKGKVKDTEPLPSLRIVIAGRDYVAN